MRPKSIRNAIEFMVDLDLDEFGPRDLIGCSGHGWNTALREVERSATRIRNKAEVSIRTPLKSVGEEKVAGLPDLVPDIR
jgi:hypothetical protein